MRITIDYSVDIEIPEEEVRRLGSDRVKDIGGAIAQMYKMGFNLDAKVYTSIDYQPDKDDREFC